MDDEPESLFDHQGGTEAPWYRGRQLTDEKRDFFRERSRRSHRAKLAAVARTAISTQAVNQPTLRPADLMPQVARHHLPALSLFSGGGGLDLGFWRAGFGHVASYDTLEAAGHTLRENRPEWKVHAGSAGNVRTVDWRVHRDQLAVIHGGPPCQPFSVAGRQRGSGDERNLLPEFVRAVQEARPLAFVAENVPALAGPRFATYLEDHFAGPLSRDYRMTMFRLSAHEFGVPQVRQRVFFVGFRSVAAARRFGQPLPTHRADHLRGGPAGHLGAEAPTLGVRAALGLTDIGTDMLAPTLRSTLTGPRHTTSILSSASAQKVWAAIGVWPNGVAPTRRRASEFPTENGHHRLAVADCAVLQGFPSWWSFHGATYMSLGQIGNSVAPPVAYHVALAVARALGFDELG
jgi:DNA (cytosine-5)-methyltransferase 1